MSSNHSSGGAKARAGGSKDESTMLDKYLDSEATVVERIGLAQSKLSKKQTKKKAVQDKKAYLEDWNTSWKKATQ